MSVLQSPKGGGGRRRDIKSMDADADLQVVSKAKKKEKRHAARNF
jgi:hypothetical protein